MVKKTTTKGKRAAGKDKVMDEEASLKKVDGDWGESSVKAQELEDLRERGLLPSLEEMKTRAPGKDTVPSPRAGERVYFVDFLPRGFGFFICILFFAACFMFMGFRSMI